MFDPSATIAALALLATNATGIWVVASRLGRLVGKLEAHDQRLINLEGKINVG